MKKTALNMTVDLVVTVLLVLTFVFFALRILPGDPALAALGDLAGPEQIARFRQELGLDEPLASQYFHFVLNMLQFDFGQSMANNEPVSDILLKSLPYTLELTVASMLIGMLIGMPAGILSAVYRGGPMDYGARVFALLGFCIPDFYLGALFLIAFALTFDWFPIMGGGDGFLDRMYHLVLPASTLGLVLAAFTSRLTRSSLLEVMGKDYVRTARAKGAAEVRVIGKHALRNALIPVVTGFGIYTLTLLSGSISIELIFSRPGIGSVLVNAIEARDYTVVQAGLVMFSFFVVVVNFAMDLLYAVVDPRIRVGA